MPPSRHSRSSHSSRSHRSSSHRRSSSSHSSRSHSSRGASSSYSSYTGTTMRGTVISRLMTNQPTGWKNKKRLSTHYCKNHNYTLYPEDWTDVGTGRQFKAGYYDENGQYYDKISFGVDGRYNGVLCHCPYCEQDSFKSFGLGEESSLVCASCGGAMEIKSAFDTYTQDPNYTNSEHKAMGSVVRVIVIFAVIMMCFTVIDNMIDFFAGMSNDNAYRDTYTQSSGYQPAAVSNVDIYGSTVYMKQMGDGEYAITDDSSDYDKKLTWDYGYDSYYDKDSDCYVWFNTDVSPNLWQYWYEGISSDYGDYGWMEYEPSGWYIEKSEGSWEQIDVSAYGSRIWHFPVDEGQP